MATNAHAQTAAFKQALACIGITEAARDVIVEQGVVNMEACRLFNAADGPRERDLHCQGLWQTTLTNQVQQSSHVAAI